MEFYLSLPNCCLLNIHFLEFMIHICCTRYKNEIYQSDKTFLQCYLYKIAKECVTAAYHTETGKVSFFYFTVLYRNLYFTILIMIFYHYILSTKLSILTLSKCEPIKCFVFVSFSCDNINLEVLH